MSNAKELCLSVIVNKMNKMEYNVTNNVINNK